MQAHMYFPIASSWSTTYRTRKDMRRSRRVCRPCMAHAKQRSVCWEVERIAFGFLVLLHLRQRSRASADSASRL